MTLISVQEIAKAANVSQSTVSKVLNGYKDVSSKTRQKVLDVANQLGYVPNAAAISLVKKKSHMIGIIYEVSSGFSNLFFSAILESFRTEAESLGYTLMLLSQNESNNTSYLKHCLSHKIDAVFVLSTQNLSRVEAELKHHGISVLTLDPLGDSSSSVSTNNHQAMMLSLDYLYALGHRKIAFVQGALTSYVGKARVHAYLDFVNDKQLTAWYIPDRDNERYSLQEGYDTTKDLIKTYGKPDAIACASDLLALGAIYCLQDHGYHVPHDVSVMGFDDLRVCEIVRPKLSTIRQDYQTIGKMACVKLIEMSENQSRVEPMFVDAHLVVRDSTKSRK